MRLSYSLLINGFLLLLLLTPMCLSAADGTVVRMETPLGNIEVELSDTITPQTVENFLKYVNDGDFTNSIIHRNIPGFIIQGGEFTYENGQTEAVPADPPVINEFSQSNIRGTIAMAKLGGDPNSATSEWFFNLANNAANLDAQNGGFTVFGRVISGMDVVDAIAALTIWNAGGAFTDIPLIDYPGSGDIQRSHLVIMNSVAVVADLPEEEDDDGDGVANSDDNCPSIANSNQKNTDGDSQGNACDADDDNDGVSDQFDNCRVVSTPGQSDHDGDGDGSACDDDDDNDGVDDQSDNCRTISNTNQIDTDRDGQGNVCDDDDDGDGVGDAQDVFPLNGTETTDTDGDGIGNNFEERFGMNANDSSDASLDNDGDGSTNLEEFRSHRNPTVSEPSIVPLIIDSAL